MAYPINKTEYLTKIANSIEMSFEIPDAEKAIAEEAKIRFESTLKRINDCAIHLDIIYEPFKRHETVSTKSLVGKRGLLNRYKQKVKENFNVLKTVALLAIRKLDRFATGDTSIQEILNSFIDSIEDVEKLVNKFLEIMSDYESESFRTDVMSSIDGIKSQSSKLETLVRDRIIDHINTNILSNNWMSSQRDELNLEIEERAPLITELFDERQKALDPNSFPSGAGEGQTLNPGNAQKIHYSNHLSTMQIGEFGE